jgi:hypothetical protein
VVKITQVATSQRRLQSGTPSETLQRPTGRDLGCDEVPRCIPTRDETANLITTKRNPYPDVVDRVHNGEGVAVASSHSAAYAHETARGYRLIVNCDVPSVGFVSTCRPYFAAYRVPFSLCPYPQRLAGRVRETAHGDGSGDCRTIGQEHADGDRLCRCDLGAYVIIARRGLPA